MLAALKKTLASPQTLFLFGGEPWTQDKTRHILNHTMRYVTEKDAARDKKVSANSLTEESQEAKAGRKR